MAGGLEARCSGEGFRNVCSRLGGFHAYVGARCDRAALSSCLQLSGRRERAIGLRCSGEVVSSSAAFVCKHVFSNVRGMFQQPSGTVILDDATPANSRVNATIKVSSITTGVEERDTHLKSAEFFDVTKYPVITFVSSSVSKSSATSYSVTGSLTMHGVSKPVTLAVTASPPFNHAGGIRRAIEATTSVNRRDFGLHWDFPGEGTGVVVGDNIKITIDAELVLQPETSKRG